MVGLCLPFPIETYIVTNILRYVPDKDMPNKSFESDAVRVAAHRGLI